MRFTTFLTLGLAAVLQGSFVLAQAACGAGSIPVSGDCELCPRDTFQDGSICSPCPSGYYSSPGATQCTAYVRSVGPGPSQVPRALVQIPYNGTDAPSGHCLERSTDIERCGACLDDEKDDGVDCSLLDHYESVKCIKGKCVYEGLLEEAAPSAAPTPAPTGPRRLVIEE